jgi:hypothetical protein
MIEQLNYYAEKYREIKTSEKGKKKKAKIV